MKNRRIIAMSLRTLNEMLLNSKDKFKDRPAFKVKRGKLFHSYSYEQFYQKVEQFGTGLLELGFKKGDHIGLISENRFEWIISDLSIIGIGAIDVPASGNSYARDIAFKLKHSDSIATILEGEKVFLEYIKASPDLSGIKTIILLEQVKVFSEVGEVGEWAQEIPYQENGQISRAFYKKLSSVLNENSALLLISKKANLFLEKYVTSFGKKMAEDLQVSTGKDIKKELWKKIFVIDPDKDKKTNFPSILLFSTVEELGKRLLADGDKRFASIYRQALPDDLITIIYTSGTTSDPKGVMLTHDNIMHNVNNVPGWIGDLNERDRFLSVLPSWHIYERTVEYCALSIGASTAYSKPFKQILLPDLLLEKPTLICTVPRIWHSLYKGIVQKIKNGSKLQQLLFFKGLEIAKKYKHSERVLNNTLPLFDREQFSEKERVDANSTVRSLAPLYKLVDSIIFKKIRHMLGGEVKFAISGGGSLPEDIDIFLDATGVLVLEGYGLTETSPIVAGRVANNPVMFTVGETVPNTEVKIIDKDNPDIEVSNGKAGIVFVKGALVMKGYYKNEKRTAEVLKDGWFNTGDLGRKTFNGKYLKIIGRIKDTIVLVGGENVEPQPLEDKLKESPYVNMAIVVGQDKPRLGALIIPDFETLKEYADQKHLSYQDKQDLIEKKEIVSLFQQEQKRLISKENGFQPFETVMGIALLSEEFSLEKGEMTESLKLRRFVIHEKYEQLIDQICSK